MTSTTMAIVAIAAIMTLIGAFIAFDGARRLRRRSPRPAVMRPNLALAEIAVGLSLIAGVVMASLETTGLVAF